MCYEALLDGRAREQTLSRLFRGELFAATKNGLVAAVVVALVVGYRGLDLPLMVGATLGAFALGVLLHQLLLVAGVATVRLWDTHRVSDPDR